MGDCKKLKQYRNIESAARSFGTTKLYQEDFDNGTYRIKTGGYYKIKENIEFNPTGTRPDEPIGGWFTIISIETSQAVVLDLEGHTVKESLVYFNNRTLIFFSIIELDNSVLPGAIFRTSPPAPTTFTGETNFVSGSNFIIRNGFLSRSSHWGIRGSINDNFFIHNLSIDDYQLAAISITGPSNYLITNICIDGIKTAITARGILATIDTTLAILAGFAQDPSVLQALIAFQAFVAQNPQVFRTPVQYPDASALYGIQVTLPIVPGGEVFPVTVESCELSNLISKVPRGKNAIISNIRIKNLIHQPIEVPAVGSLLQPNLILLPLVGIVGVLRWEDIFDNNGNFAPNDYIKGIAVAAGLLLTIRPQPPGLFPANILDILNSIINSDENLFFQNARPTFGRDIQAGIIKGLFNIRFDCNDNSIISNITGENSKGIGAPGTLLQDLPGAQHYNFEQEKYIGNDVWNLEFAVNNKLNISNIKSKNISSLNGSVFGVDDINQNSGVVLNNASNIKLIGYKDGAIGTADYIVNPPSENYGYRIKNNLTPTIFKNISSNGIITPRNSIGVGIEDAHDVVVKNSSQTNIIAFSSQYLPSPTNPLQPATPKRAVAYLVENSVNTKLINIRGCNIIIDGEEVVLSSISEAIGVEIDEDSVNTLIDCYRFKNIIAGKGTASVIKDEGQGTVIKACD